MSKPTHNPIRCFEGEAEPHEPFWKMVDAADGNDPEIWLEGYISEYSWFEDDITPKMFKDDLYRHGNNGPITIRINSYGGDVVAAHTMHMIIRDYPGKVTTQIDAVAASAATMVAIAGDVVKISNIGYFMIHDPSYVFFLAQLNIEEMTRLANSLQAVKEGIVNAYEAKSGLSRARISKLMTDETWMDAQRALDLGFVDEIVQKQEKVFDIPENAAVVNMVRNYANVPPQVMEAIESMRKPAEGESSAPVLTDEERDEARALRERVDKILRKGA